MNTDLCRAFSVLNKCYFQDRIQQVQFILNSAYKGIFHPRFPRTIEIGSGLLNAQPVEVLDDLLHVMIHLENNQFGVVDFTDNQYHRREFSDKALDFGLMLVWHKTRGWGITTSNTSKVSGKVRYPDPQKNKRLLECYAKIAEVKLDGLKNELSKCCKSHKVFQLKYVCGCKPPVIIRSGRRPDGPNPLNVVCEICKTKFVPADE